MIPFPSIPRQTTRRAAVLSQRAPMSPVPRSRRGWTMTASSKPRPAPTSQAPATVWSMRMTHGKLATTTSGRAMASVTAASIPSPRPTGEVAEIDRASLARPEDDGSIWIAHRGPPASLMPLDRSWRSMAETNRSCQPLQHALVSQGASMYLEGRGLFCDMACFAKSGPQRLRNHRMATTPTAVGEGINCGCIR